MTVPSNLIQALKDAKTRQETAAKLVQLTNAEVAELEIQVRQAEEAEAKKKADEGPSFDELFHLVLKDNDGYLEGALANVLKNYVALKTGYTHGSDYYDDGMYTDGSSYDSDYDMSNAKEEFAGIAVNAIKEAGNNLCKVRGFGELYKILKEAGYKKYEWELTREICKSEKVSAAYAAYATRYDG